MAVYPRPAGRGPLRPIVARSIPAGSEVPLSPHLPATQSPGQDRENGWTGLSFKRLLAALRPADGRGGVARSRPRRPRGRRCARLAPMDNVRRLRPARQAKAVPTSPPWPLLNLVRAIFRVDSGS